MTQALLPFDRPPAVRTSPTSVAAAESVRPKLSRLRQIVLDYIRSCPDGCTDEQIIDAVNLGPNTPRPRRIELVRMGLVYDSGLTARTRSGREAVLWQATEERT